MTRFHTGQPQEKERESDREMGLTCGICACILGVVGVSAFPGPISCEGVANGLSCASRSAASARLFFQPNRVSGATRHSLVKGNHLRRLFVVARATDCGKDCQHLALPGDPLAFRLLEVSYRETAEEMSEDELTR